MSTTIADVVVKLKAEDSELDAALKKDASKLDTFKQKGSKGWRASQVDKNWDDAAFEQFKIDEKKRADLLEKKPIRIPAHVELKEAERGNLIEEVKGFAGRGSVLEETMKMARGAGALMGISEMGKIMGETSAKAVELRNALREGADRGKALEEAMEGLPLVGGFVRTVANVRELITEEKRLTDEIMEAAHAQDQYTESLERAGERHLGLIEKQSVLQEKIEAMNAGFAAPGFSAAIHHDAEIRARIEETERTRIAERKRITEENLKNTAPAREAQAKYVKQLEDYNQTERDTWGVHGLREKNRMSSVGDETAHVLFDKWDSKKYNEEMQAKVKAEDDKIRSMYSKAEADKRIADSNARKQLELLQGELIPHETQHRAAFAQSRGGGDYFVPLPSTPGADIAQKYQAETVDRLGLILLELQGKRAGKTQTIGVPPR